MYSNDRDIEQFKSAEAACHRALTLDRRAANVYIALGNLYRHSGQTAQAMDEFSMALSLSHSAPDAYLGLADTYMLDQQPELAGRNYGKALELQPNYWQALMSMGNFHFDTGQVEQAIPYYERIVELMPDSESALSNLASANFMLGHYQQASQFWEKSLALQPSALAYSNLATGLYFQGHFDDALPLYRRAVQLSPEDYELWGNLGDSYRYASADQALAQPMFEKALQLAQKRLQVNPDDADTLALMAHYAASIGRREQALDYLARADPLNSGDIRIQYGAVTALCRLGESERALELLELVLEGGYPRHMVRADPSLAVLADKPRFKELTGQP
jgi:tetratricopeptide (TPR) repeat protein